MAAKPVTIGDRHFSSQSAALKYLSERLNSYELGQRVSDQDAALLMDLLAMHRDQVRKIGCGINHWTVERNGPSNGGGAPFGSTFTGRTIRLKTSDTGKSSKVSHGPLESEKRLANAIRPIVEKVRMEAFDHPPVLVPGQSVSAVSAGARRAWVVLMRWPCTALANGLAPARRACFPGMDCFACHETVR